MTKRFFCFLLMLALTFLIIGCVDGTKETASENPTNENSEENNNHNAGENNENGAIEKVSVALMIHWGEDSFEDLFRRHVEDALPHIELTYIQARDKNDIEENFAKGLIPDLVMGSNFRMYQELDLTLDQTPLIEKHGLDYDRIDSSIIKSLENNSPEGEIYALPLFRPDYLMGFNKDIFDAFAVPYPEDNMTWDEVIELAKQLTGEVDGRQYHGLWPDREQLSQVSNSLINVETNEPNILDNEDLRLFLERQEAIFNIPGNLPEMDSIDELAEFMYKGDSTHNLIYDYALVPGRGPLGYVSEEGESGLNFDLVTYPVWGGDHPAQIPNGLYHNIFVTSQSENPDAAFEVLKYLLSDEYQGYSMSEGRITPLVSNDVRNEYGKALEHYDILQEKNWQALFTIPSAPIPDMSPYEGSIREELLIDAYKGLLVGDDINTILRVMNEKAENMIADLSGRE